MSAAVIMDVESAAIIFYLGSNPALLAAIFIIINIKIVIAAELAFNQRGIFVLHRECRHLIECAVVNRLHS
jgi:hypothetical protein